MKNVSPSHNSCLLEAFLYGMPHMKPIRSHVLKNLGWIGT